MKRWPTIPLPEAYWFQEGPGVRKWQFCSSGVKLLNVANITKEGLLDLSKSDRHLASEEVAKKYSHFLADEGDLVIASSGISFDEDGLLRTRGAFVEAHHLPLCLNTSTIRFKPKAGVSSLALLRYWLDSLEFRSQITRLVTGSAQQNFGPSHLKATRISLPPLAEQERIVKLLDEADGLRKLRAQANRRTAALIPSLFHEMFGDPSTNSKGWAVKPFGDLASNQDGRRKPVKASDRAELKGEYPYYGASGIIDYVDDYLFDETALLIGEDGANLLARSTPIAFLAHGKYWVNNHAHVVIDNGKADLNYLCAALNLRDLTDYVTGCAQPKLNQANMNRMPIPVPPLPLQKEFAARVSEIRTLQAEQAASRRRLDNLFRSMLHRAFNGEL